MNSPTLPDPVKTATAQANLSHVNQTGPFASQTTQQTGTNPDGTPQYTANTSLTGAGSTLQGQIQNNLAQPLDFSQQKDYLNNLTNSGLDRNADRARNSLAQKLANSGIQVGSEAAKNATRDLESGISSGYNTANVNNFTTAQNSATALRDLPIQELAQLLGGTQQPAQGNGGVNFGQLAQNNYDNQNAQQNGFWGGVGNIGSTLGSWLFSDERLKEDIGDTGMVTAQDHIPVKTFSYTGSPILNMGVMAQDVEKVRPDAVRKTPEGIFQVNYSAIKSPMLMLGAKRAA